MDWTFLAFLAEPWFVIPWYVIGLLGAALVILDVHHNTPLKQPMKWGWPIIVFFFSILGIALYYWTARAPGIEQLEGDEARQQAHNRYQQSMFRRVNGAVIHCVAGDGLGIMTAMVIARWTGMSFWQEFWFEYAVGFAFGWFIFQLKSMKMMTDSLGRALAMAFRAEFFSMLTVMSGMGAVMTYVTPMVVGAQPSPLTWAFWGFGMLGLMVGYVATFPMNYLMVRLGWKHGMGSSEDSRPIQDRGRRALVLGTMATLGVLALLLPAWLTERRNGARADSAPLVAAAAQPAEPLGMLAGGLRGSLNTALRNLGEHHRTEAVIAMDAALRAAETGHAAAPASGFSEALHRVRRARHAFQVGNRGEARRELVGATAALRGFTAAGSVPLPPARCVGAVVLDPHGYEVGEVAGSRGDSLMLRLGGTRDVWGVMDLGPAVPLTASADDLVMGPARTIGLSFVVLPPGVPGGDPDPTRFSGVYR